MHIGTLLDLKNDYVFKRIFGYSGSEEITTGLISSILRRKITDLKLGNSEILNKDVLDDKIGILDIRAKIDNIINCDIEMQVVNNKNIEKRILFYWSKMYGASIKTGKDYDKLEKTIVILISDYELKELKEIKKYITKWNIREEDYQKIILTDVMELYIIELPKVEKYCNENENKELNFWMKFIKKPEVVEMNEMPKEIKKAKKLLEEISQDEHERYLAELREKYIMDQKTIEDAGYDKGYDEGYKVGIKEGEKNLKREIAQKMKQQKVEIETIISITGLTKEEINNL